MACKDAWLPTKGQGSRWQGLGRVIDAMCRMQDTQRYQVLGFNACLGFLQLTQATLGILTLQNPQLRLSEVCLHSQSAKHPTIPQTVKGACGETASEFRGGKTDP
jgi:hypothetical protein